MNDYVTGEHVLHLSQSVPFCRTYCCEVCYLKDFDNFCIHAHLVTAVQTVVVNLFSIPGEFRILPPTAEEAYAEGWAFEEQQIRSEYLFHDSEYGLVSSESDLLQCSNSVWGVVQCPWPYEFELDNALIQKLLLDLSDSAKQKHMDSQKRANISPVLAPNPA